MSTNVRTIAPNHLGQSVHKPNLGTRQNVQGCAATYGLGALQSVGTGGSAPVVTSIQLINRHGANPRTPLGFI
jgi:hypothetical protein